LLNDGRSPANAGPTSTSTNSERPDYSKIVLSLTRLDGGTYTFLTLNAGIKLIGGEHMKSTLLKTAGMALLLAGMGGLLLAVQGVPEIDAASAGNAIVLLGGAVLMIRGRKK
jgi:hypothetical protein